jgi:O-antigen/teichoic acid export membrane protein
MELALNACVFLPIIAISYTMISLQIIPYNIAIANGYTRLNNILGILSLIITVPGYWLATHFYGAIGTASVFCIVQIAITTVYIFYINKKFLTQISTFLLYIRGIIIPIAIAVLIAYIFSIFISAVENSRILSICYIGVSSFFTFSILVLITFLKEVKGNRLIKYFKF